MFKYTLIVMSAFASFCGTSYAEMTFFESGIDYWDQRSRASQRVEMEKNSDTAAASEKFDWQPYLDPQAKEFFREGDYLPPEPFMEIVRNPSDENLSMWFTYIQKKNELSERLQQRLTEYAAKHSPSAPLRKELTVATPVISKIRDEAKRFRFRFYFDSGCPHCRRMFKTMEAIQAQGYFVEARQIDDASGEILDFAVPIAKATGEEVKRHRVDSVPFLLVGDLKEKMVYRFKGYQSAAEIHEKLRNAR